MVGRTTQRCRPPVKLLIAMSEGKAEQAAE